jgi:hypothetical protein
MFTMKVATIASILVVGANAAAAFEFSGAEVELEYRDEGSSNDAQVNFDASFALSFGSGIGMQFGLKNAHYTPGSDGSFGYELHGTYGVSDNLTLGVFVGEEKFSSIYQYYGIEADYSTDVFSINSAVSRYEGPGYEATQIVFDGGYSINGRFGLLAGYHKDNLASGDTSYTYLGASYAAVEGVNLTAKYGVLDQGTSVEVLTLGIAYTLGEGVTFGNRSYTETFPTD